MKLVLGVLAVLILQSVAIAAELPRAIGLKNLNKEQVGLMLLDVKPTEKAGEFIGTCFFILLPRSAEAIDSELGILIYDLRVAGDHPCRVLVSKKKTEVTASPAKLPIITVVLGSSGLGTLSITKDGVTRPFGFAERKK